MPAKVRIVGAGLIGTSIGLGLIQRGIAVDMVDSDPRAQALAQDLTGGSTLEDPDLVILATPVSALALLLEPEFSLNPLSTFMDICSVKSEVVLQVEAVPGLSTSFCPTHPMAGREIGGTGSARADLFQGRSWIITPGSELAASSRAMVVEVIELLGATVLELSPAAHDAAVAKISHLPQITASLLAKQLHGTPSEWMELAGQGLRDSTRIAGSDEKLWMEIIYANRAQISGLLGALQSDLAEMIQALDSPSSIEEIIASGRRGRALIPGKHGGKAREYSYLPIVIDDKPGQLALIFNECAALSVNVEDFDIEHSPGQLSALITLSLSDEDAQRLGVHLAAIGWNVHPIRK